jgi:hypothetical protein
MDTLDFTESAIRAANDDQEDLQEFVQDQIEYWIASQTLVTIIFDDNHTQGGPIAREDGESEGCRKGPTLPVDTKRLDKELELDLDEVDPETKLSISSQDISRFCPNGLNPHLWKFMPKIELVIPEHFMQPIFRQESIYQVFKIFKKQLEGDGEDKKDFESILPDLIKRFKTLEKYSMLIFAFDSMNLGDFPLIFKMIGKDLNLSEDSNKKRKVE